MNYTQFVTAYKGKSTDYDGAYGAQCVDLIKIYLDKVFNIKAGSWGDAKYYWIDYAKHPELVRAFEKIPNTPTFVPAKGDIVVWKAGISKTNDSGHVAVANGIGNTSYFYSLDQNWGGKTAKDVKHTYSYVYGVLRPKDQSKITGVISAPAGVKYLPKYTGKSVSLVDGLAAVGATSTFSYRKKIAAANGITGYIGMPSQNTKMLNLLKKGKLIKP